MDRRTPLDSGTKLCFMNPDGGEQSFFTGDIIGRGASCLVYDGYYINHSGTKKTVRIKECYPYRSGLVRDEDGFIRADAGKKDENADLTASFDKAKSLFRASFDVCNGIYESEGLTNATTNLIDIYEGNGTLYTVATYDEGDTLAIDERTSLKDRIHIVKNLAKIIHRIHENGYLYLDIKPDNIFILSGMDGAIRLLDFDSLIPINPADRIGEYRLSYSKGFAALEQRKGRLLDIGRYTDVYGVGAVLFYLVFGRVPEALDCGIDSAYDYTASGFDPYKYRDRLWKGMTEFFHNSLSSYYKDRYEDIVPVIEKLEELESYADLSTPFVCDTYFPVIDGMIGREQEKASVMAFLQNDTEKCLLISGMGGIGKSTLVRTCLAACQDAFDLTVYLYFKGSVMETFTDDHSLTINTVERDKDESVEEYFERKLSAIKRIIGDGRAVLVMDDFAGNPGDEILSILNAGFRVILVSRERIESDEWRTLAIEEMKKDADTTALFVKYLQRELMDDEKNDAMRLISDVRGHTLAIELIAKQVKRSLLTMKEAAELVVTKGLTLMSPEKVYHSQDGSLRMCHVEAIFQELIRRDHFKPEKLGLLKALSLYSPAGVREDILKELMGKAVGDDLYDLAGAGWIDRGENQISVHPVIRETVLGMKPEKKEYVPINRMFINLTRKVTDLGAGERYGDKSELRGSDVFGYSVDVLINAADKKHFRATKPYYRLFCPTVLELPRDREDVILDFTSHLEEAWEYADPLILIRVIDYACYILYEKGDMDAAIQILAKAGRFAKQTKDPRLIGMFYEAESQFYDTLLAGGYESDDPVDKHFRKEMIESEDAAMRYLYRAFLGDRKRYFEMGAENKEVVTVAMHLAEIHLTKANYASRSYPAGHMSDRKIRKHISTAKGYLDMLPHEDEILKITYELSVAWYYTMVEPDVKKTVYIVRKLLSNPNPWSSNIDLIDFVLVPCSEMMFRLGHIKDAKYILGRAVRMCSERDDISPYMRKKAELLDHLEDLKNWEKHKGMRLNEIETDEPSLIDILISYDWDRK